MFISETLHQINQCDYEFENANYDVGHTNGINKWVSEMWAPLAVSREPAVVQNRPPSAVYIF